MQVLNEIANVARRAGLRTILAGNSLRVDAMFTGAPAGMPRIMAEEPIDRLAADVEGGLAIVRDDGLSVSLYYAGQVWRHGAGQPVRREYPYTVLTAKGLAQNDI